MQDLKTTDQVARHEMKDLQMWDLKMQDLQMTDVKMTDKII